MNLLSPKFREPTAHRCCLQLLHGLLRRNPMERMGYEEFFSHPFLTAAAQAQAPPPGLTPRGMLILAAAHAPMVGGLGYRVFKTL